MYYHRRNPAFTDFWNLWKAGSPVSDLGHIIPSHSFSHAIALGNYQDGDFNMIR